jgi:hypothetical protein
MKAKLLDCTRDQVFVGKRIELSVGKNSIVNYLSRTNKTECLGHAVKRTIYYKKREMCGQSIGHLIDYKVLSSKMNNKCITIIVEITQCELDNG